MSTQPDSGLPSTNPTEDRRTDPAMKALYQMSRTAGVGLQDYASVNVACVLAITVGVITLILSLVFKGADIYFFTGAIAFVLGVVGFVQVQNSNQTQTGKMLAIGGVVAAGIGCALAGFDKFRIVREDIQHRKDIVAFLETFGQTLQGGEMDKVFDEFHPTFQARFKDQKALLMFSQRMQDFANGQSSGGIRFVKIDSDASANPPVIQINRRFGSDDVYADVLMYVHYPAFATPPKEGEIRVPERVKLPVRVIKTDEQWKISGLDAFFPVQ
jgi:hypothetical protein